MKIKYFQDTDTLSAPSLNTTGVALFIRRTNGGEIDTACALCFRYYCNSNLETPEMMTNDVLRSLRYMLDLADAHVVDIIKLTGYEVSQQDVASWLKKEGEEGFAECPAMSLAHFLDGLIIFRRGKNENAAAERAARSASNNLSLSNNQVLKKLRVAFELKEDDLNSIMDAVGFKISKPELSALLRKEGHKNYRPCGDQFLRNFLKGLTLRIRG